MGNCFGLTRNGVTSSHCTQSHNHGESPEDACRSQAKKLSYPLPLPPQHISTYAQKLPSPSPGNEMMVFSTNLKSFTLKELICATRCFCPKYLLEEGGFGHVYKGWLDKETLTPIESGSGMAVVVKKLKPQGFQGHKEWLSEITYLGQLAHPNLVNLIGFCSEGKNRLLVYEFMPKGSLENHLFRRTGSALPLSWTLRIKVAVEAARGLSFLHASETKITYRDFNSSNILLDKDYNAKLSDFGLAKSGLTGDWTHITTQVIGTQGYTAPEYMAKGILTTKCDVYSFGIVLLELITGRRAIDNRQLSEEKKLLEWVRPQLKDVKKLSRIMDTKLEGQYSRKEAYVVANLALQCCHPQAKYRPHMSDVLSILENIPCSRADRYQGMLSSKSKVNTDGPNKDGYCCYHGHDSSMQWTPQSVPLMRHT